jgi:hypothetical protein
VRSARIQFFGEAGTEVGCGIYDAHQKWHRNRFLFLQFCLSLYSNDRRRH